MKKLLLLTLTFPVLLWNCKNFDERTKFDVTYINRVTFIPESMEESGQILSDTLILNFADDVADHDSKISQVEYVRMTAFSIELDKLKSEGVDNMNFLESIECFQISDHTEDLLVAKTDQIPKDKGFFEVGLGLKDRDMDLEHILSKDVSTYRVVYKLKSPIKGKAVLKLGAKYEIDTKKFGI